MKRDLPVRFWFEAALAALGLFLFVLTLFSREWIEELTGLDPDGGSGGAEYLIAFGLLAVALLSGLAARRDFRGA